MVRSIAEIRCRLLRRTAVSTYYPFCMMMMLIVFILATVVGIGAALGQFWDNVCADIYDLWHEFIVDAHRRAKRTWNK